MEECFGEEGREGGREEGLEEGMLQQLSFTFFFSS